jgi:death on curing protein
MRYLSLGELLTLYEAVMKASGGLIGIRDLGQLEASLAKPRLTFNGVDLYPELCQKAGALGFSLIANHPFVDGNKRIGHAAMEAFLMLNGFEIAADLVNQEDTIMRVAAGAANQEQLTEWLKQNTKESEQTAGGNGD